MLNETFTNVFVTCGSEEEAEMIARKLVQKRLAACVNILPEVKSVFRWKGNIETDSEYLLHIKTVKQQLTMLIEEIIRLHSYDVPEIIAVPISEGYGPYLSWIQEAVKPE